MTKPPLTESDGRLRWSFPATDRRPDDNPRPDISAELRRRRVAAARCEPLPDGRRDPADPIDEPLSDAELDAWRAAWRHLHRAGLGAIIPTRVLAAAARRGGDAA
ncbi:MAG: hypothetical protein ACRDQU_06720 [Pseudonocardiaceae bacterium]